MYRIAICDNEAPQLAKAAAGVEKWLRAHPEVEGKVEQFRDPVPLLAGGAVYDLYLLDIMMPGVDGIEVGRQVRAQNQRAAILYLTSSPDYALDAYGVTALRYLQKPIDPAALQEALDTAWLLYTSRPKRTVMLYGKNGVRRVAVEDVVFIENDARNMTWHLRDGSCVECGHRGLSFEEAAAPVVERHGAFIQTHKSYFVNMAYIKEIQPGGILLDDDTRVPITRRRFTEIRNAYLDYVAGEEVEV